MNLWTWLRAQLRGEPVLVWDHDHIPNYADRMGRCAVCGKPRAQELERCPGPTELWRPHRFATVACELLHEHGRYGGSTAGCEICVKPKESP